MGDRLIKKGFSIILIGLLIILSLTPVVNSGVNIKSEELSTQNIVEKNCLCQQNIKNDHIFDQLDSWESDDEYKHSLIRKYDNIWEQQKMVVTSNTSIICGYVTDGETGLPVENAKVDIELSGGYWISTYTNSTGFYCENAPPTYSIRLHVQLDGYLSKYYCCYVLYENKTLWVNMSILSRPPETSVFYGYVINEKTNDPLEDAQIELEWRNENGGYYNYTYTDSQGFYSMNVGAPGSMQLCVFADGYFTECWKEGYWYDIDENETVWANISLYPRPIENSVIYGFILDKQTGDPIENAEVEFRWNGSHVPHYSNFTYTDSQGYYSINAAAGRVVIFAYASGYWSKYSPVLILGENESLWVNLSLNPLPPESSVVCGYITDVNTGEPIELAWIELNWEEYTMYRPWNETYTGTSGFYKMNLPAGEFYLDVNAHGYLYEETDHYNITENETIWLNISIYPIPPINSVVCGYITNEDTGEPLEDGYVDYKWRDPYGHEWWMWEFTNASGFYMIKTPAGEVRLYVDYYHYFGESIDWFNISENETLWINFSLELDNYPPDGPYINGPKRGKPGEEYNYTFSTWDYYYDDVYYYIDWGDGKVDEWIGPYAHDEEVMINHTWFEKGTYIIKAKAKDVYGAESDWGYFQVKIPRNRVLSNSLFFILVEKFPLLQKLIDILERYK